MIKKFGIFFLYTLLSYSAFDSSALGGQPSQNTDPLTQYNHPFVAFIRVKNEINTLEACLNSIQEAFDKIIIIYSNEADDGSKEFIKKWCIKSRFCEHHEYPHFVIPSHDERYKNNPDYENTLASYYNFGLSFFDPEDFVVKIDADQIYFSDQLVEIFETIRQKTAKNDKIHFGINGFNTFIFKDSLMNHQIRLNGGADSFILKRKYIKGFYQKKYFEKIQTSINLPYFNFSQPVWFHFMTKLRTNGNIKDGSEAEPDEYSPLDETQQELFIKNVLPYLKKSHSVYQNLNLKKPNDIALDKQGV